MADLMHSCTYIRVTCSSSSFSCEVKHRKRRVGGSQLVRDGGDGLTPVQQRGRGRDLKHHWRMAIRRLWSDVREVGLPGGRHRSRQRIGADLTGHGRGSKIGALLGEVVVTGPWLYGRLGLVLGREGGGTRVRLRFVPLCRSS